MSDNEQSSSGFDNVVQELLDALAAGLTRQNKANPPKPNHHSGDWGAVNHYDHIVVYHGDEEVMKIRPEDADDLVGQLALALRKRRGGDHGE